MDPNPYIGRRRRKMAKILYRKDNKKYLFYVKTSLMFACVHSAHYAISGDGSTMHMVYPDILQEQRKLSLSNSTKCISVCGLM
jgi:hypothetical protein